MGVDVQPRHPGSNPRGCEFGFLLFIKKTRCGGLPHCFPLKKEEENARSIAPNLQHQRDVIPVHMTPENRFSE
jgi:hypothetical protein